MQKLEFLSFNPQDANKEIQRKLNEVINWINAFEKINNLTKEEINAKDESTKSAGNAEPAREQQAKP